MTIPEQPKQFDFSKPEDKKEFEGLMPTEKQEVINHAQDEQNIVETVAVKNETYNEKLDRLLEEINQKQEAITAETLKKVQDIYSNHFAVHGTEIKSLFSVLNDGIFSKNAYDNYKEKGLPSKRYTEFIPKKEDFTTDNQGRDRISTFSAQTIINALNNIEKEDYTTDIISSTIRGSQNHEQKTQEISNEILKNFDGAKILRQYPAGIRSIHINIRSKIDKKIEIDKDTYLKFFFLLILTNDHGDGSVFDDEFIKKIRSSLNNINPDPNALTESKKTLSVLNATDPNILWNIYNGIDKNLFVNNLYKRIYGAMPWKVPGVNLLIDTDKINDFDLQNSPLEVGLDGKPKNPFEYFSYNTELPITKRIKANSICGFTLNDKMRNELALPIAIVSTILSQFNTEKLKTKLTEEDIKLIESIKSGNDMGFTKNDFLFFASRICNYNLMDRYQKYEDVIFAIANYHKLPVYDEDGNVIWPKKISHEQVANKEF